MPMANYLQMHKKQQVLALLELGWSYRRIQRETGVHRSTVGEYDQTRQSNPAKTFPGSDLSPPADLATTEGEGPADPAKTFAGSPSNPAKTFPGSTARRRFVAHAYRQAITEKLDAGLSLQRIWQDLVEEYGYSASYESVKPLRADAHADPSGRRRVSLRARGRSAGRFLPRRPHARRRDWRVATPVGLPHDARPFSSWLRRGRVGPDARSRRFCACTSARFAIWAACRA
jgi:hypothetical protein